jgi:hypothetical protein
MHSSLKTYYEPKIPPSIGICTARNAGDPQADHRTALVIMQKDYQTRWPIHNGREYLFKEGQKKEQSFDTWQVNHYTLGEDAIVEGLTGRDWLLFLLIQNYGDPVLKKKIFDLDNMKSRRTMSWQWQESTRSEKRHATKRNPSATSS